MTKEQFESLDIGDVVCDNEERNAFMVSSSNPVTLVRVITEVNPEDWDIVSKAFHPREN